MAITITVGTNSYVSADDADTYMTNRGSPAAWTAASNDAKAAALIKATQYLDAVYSWRGCILSTAQALGWPRSNVWDDEGRNVTGIPQRVKDATCELALEALSSDLLASKDRGGAVRRQKVGTLEVEYEPGAPSGKSFPIVAGILRGLTAQGTGSGGGLSVKTLRS